MEMTTMQDNSGYYGKSTRIIDGKQSHNNTNSLMNPKSHFSNLSATLYNRSTKLNYNIESRHLCFSYSENLYLTGC